MHLVDKVAYKCICCYYYHHHCYWNYYHKHYCCYHTDNLIFSLVTMGRETLIPCFGNVKWLMCGLVLSMWSVNSNISFQVYPLSFSLSSQTKKRNKNEIYNCESEVTSIQLYFYYLNQNSSPFFYIFSNWYSSLHVPFVTTINTI